MNTEEENYLKEQESMIKRLQAESNVNSANQMNQAMAMEGSEQGIIKDQLDLANELDKIEHFLRGEILKEGNNGVRTWCPAPNEDMVVLSEEGIHLILSTIQWYINKNTLLSNYDDDTISSKMEDFAHSLNDTLFMGYEKYFKTPSDEECRKVLKKRVEQKVSLKKFTAELLGKEVDPKKLEEEEWDVLGDLISKELQKIKEQLMKNKLKRFDLLLRVVQDAVHSTYLRAFKGMERRTLREHININENNGGQPTQIPQRRGLGSLGWPRKR